MGALTAEQWKELVFFVVFVLSLFCMVFFGGVVPLFKVMDERGTWQSRAAAKRWSDKVEKDLEADRTGYVIAQTMKDILE